MTAHAWAAVGSTALALAVPSIPRLRRLALATEFVDRPASRKSHTRPIPYLGGVGLIAAVLLAMLLQRPLPSRVGGIAFGAALVGTMGLIDDDRNLAPGLRLLAETVAAIGTVALGLRLDATGIMAIDLVITVAWIVGITNALNLIDNMDGLAAGI